MQIGNTTQQRIAFASSSPEHLLQLLKEQYLFALPPLQKKWILVPHLSWKVWLEESIAKEQKAFTSCTITTLDAWITSHSKVQKAILSPKEIALICSSYPKELEEFFGSFPSPLEMQKMGRLLFELSYLEESEIPTLLKDFPSISFFYHVVFGKNTSFAPWSRKFSSPLSISEPIALFQITDLPPSFLQTYAGSIAWFCLEPTPDFWADEGPLKKNVHSQIPHLLLQFGEMRKKRMKQLLDFDIEIQEAFFCEDPCKNYGKNYGSLASLREGFNTLSQSHICQALQEALLSKEDPKSIQIALLSSPLEEARFAAKWIEQKIHSIALEHASTDASIGPSIDLLSYLLCKELEEILIITPSQKGAEYAALLAVECEKITPPIPVVFEAEGFDNESYCNEHWLFLLCPVSNGTIQNLLFSDPFFAVFDIEKKNGSFLHSLSALCKTKEKDSLTQNPISLMQERLGVIQFLIETIEKDLFAYPGEEEAMELFLKKLLHLHASLCLWLTPLVENQAKTLLEWHALLNESGNLFFEDVITFDNPLSALLEKSKQDWTKPIPCDAILHFCKTHKASSSPVSFRGALRVRSFSNACIPPAKTLFLLGMNADFGGSSKQVFPSILSKERLQAKCSSSSLEKDTILDLFFTIKDSIIITSSKEESLQEASFVRSILSSAKLQLCDVLKRIPMEKPNLCKIQQKPSASLPIANLGISDPNNLPTTSWIDLADLLLFARNPLRYSLRKHLAPLLHLSDRNSHIEESFIGKSLRPYDVEILSYEELFQKQKKLQEEGLSKKGLLGALGEEKVAPFLEEGLQEALGNGRFAVHFSPLQSAPSWHSSSLLLHPPLVICQDASDNQEYGIRAPEGRAPEIRVPEIRGFVQGLHQKGVLLFQNKAASEKIEKWPLMLLQHLLFNPLSLAPRPDSKEGMIFDKNLDEFNSYWIPLPSLEQVECKADLHDENVKRCFYNLVSLYQKAQTFPCLYTASSIEAYLKEGASLEEHFTNEVANCFSSNAFSVSGREKSLALLYAGEKEWFDKALSIDFTKEIEQIYRPLFKQDPNQDPKLDSSLDCRLDCGGNA